MQSTSVKGNQLPLKTLLKGLLLFIGLNVIQPEVTLAATVNAPSGLTAVAASSSQINLRWTDNSGNESGFIVMRSLLPTSNFVTVATLPTNTVTFSNLGLSPATQYYYKVRAFLKTRRGTIYSAESNVAGAKTATATASTWTDCAVENELCSFTGTRQVRYGANGIYLYKTATGSIQCSNTAFGGDPVVGVLKACQYSSTVTTTPPSPTPAPAATPIPTITPTPTPTPPVASAPVNGAPLVLYTDIVSGPNAGGENNKGAYLSIFGKNFGSTGLGTAVKVFINNVEVDNYRFLGTSKGRSDIQQITVQVGSLGNPTPGSALPIMVTVNGVASNTDKTFRVNPGRMIFVDPVSGNDSTAVVGDITHPFKSVQVGDDLSKGAWGKVLPGDFLVLRGGTHTGVGKEKYFIRFITATAQGYASGTAPTGASGTGPITLMGYPNENAFINCDSALNPNGCLSGLNGNTFPNAGKWIVIADLRVEGGGYDGPISQQVAGNNWRIINNELTAYTGVTWAMVEAYNAAHGISPLNSQAAIAPSRMAGITGNGLNNVWAGNNIHDIYGSDCAHVGPDKYCTGSEAHGIYIDGFGSYEIAYNHIHDIKSGKGFQSYATGSNDLDSTPYAQAPEVDNVNLHHNLIHDVLTYGINVADSAKSNWVISNNVVYNSGNAGLAFNTLDLVGCKIYNNTILGTSVNNWRGVSGAVDVQNNIIDPSAFGSGNLDGTFKNNLWLNSSAGSVGFGTGAVYGDPLFVNATSDFHLRLGSPAIDTGTSTVSGTVVNDFDVTTRRPLGNAYDIGAFEYAP